MEIIKKKFALPGYSSIIIWKISIKNGTVSRKVLSIFLSLSLTSLFLCFYLCLCFSIAFGLNMFTHDDVSCDSFSFMALMVFLIIHFSIEHAFRRSLCAINSNEFFYILFLFKGANASVCSYLFFLFLSFR